MFAFPTPALIVIQYRTEIRTLFQKGCKQWCYARSWWITQMWVCSFTNMLNRMHETLSSSTITLHWLINFDSFNIHGYMWIYWFISNFTYWYNHFRKKNINLIIFWSPWSIAVILYFILAYPVAIEITQSCTLNPVW